MNENNNVVLLLGTKNKFLPSLTYLPEPKRNIIMFYIFYIFVWLSVVYYLKDNKNNNLKLIGFASGFVLLLILDYINNYSKEIFVNKKNDALTNLNIENLEVVLDNHFYKFDEIHGILIPYNNFLDLKKNKKLNSVSLKEWLNNQYSKSFGHTSIGSSIASLIKIDTKLVSSAYMLICLITLAIITSEISSALSKLIFPYIILSALFSLPILSFLIIDYRLTTLKIQEIIKTKIFTTGISFAITACLIFLFGKY